MKSVLIKDTSKAERIELIRQWQEPEDGLQLCNMDLFDLGSGHKNVINKVVTIVFKELHKIFKVDSYIEWKFRDIAFIFELFFAAPIILYIFISYYIYIVYFGIMSILEKLHIIREDEKLFKKLNKKCMRLFC